MPAKQQRMILVVDDEPDIRKLVSAMLTRCGYSVMSAATGEIAIEALQE